MMVLIVIMITIVPGDIRNLNSNLNHYVTILFEIGARI